MDNYIFLNEVISIMREVEKKKAKPFTIEFRTYNSQNKMGGRLKKIENGILCFRLPHEKKKAKKKTQTFTKKNPNHWENRTRNIEAPNGSITKVHLDLITRFNNKQVVF